jgi:hypothetical protein
LLPDRAGAVFAAVVFLAEFFLAGADIFFAGGFFAAGFFTTDFLVALPDSALAARLAGAFCSTTEGLAASLRAVVLRFAAGLPVAAL